MAFTKGPGDGENLAMKFAKSGRKLIIACGGDGTVNEVVNGIMNSGEDVELGILPAGTGGDLRRSLGMSNTPREAAKQLRDGVTKRIDLGHVAFVDHDGNDSARYFVNVASFGLSASINDRVKNKGSLQWIPGETVRGKTKFAVSAVQEVIEPNSKTVVVAFDDGKPAKLNTINFCICNARFFGGGMKIAPDAKMDDGLFDVVNIGDINTARIFLNGYRLYSGTHTELEEVKSRLTKKVSVAPANADDLIDIETDGELPGRLPAEFKIVPSALKIRVPTRSE